MRSKSDINSDNLEVVTVSSTPKDLPEKKKRRKTKSKKSLKAGISHPELQRDSHQRSSFETILPQIHSFQGLGKGEGRPRALSKASSQASADLQPLVYTIAPPRLSPMEYMRRYLLNQAKKTVDNSTECLSKPAYEWFWTPNWEEFLIIPRIPQITPHHNSPVTPKQPLKPEKTIGNPQLEPESLVSVKNINSSTSYPRLSFNLPSMATFISDVPILAALSISRRLSTESPRTKVILQNILHEKEVETCEGVDEVSVRLPSGSLRGDGASSTQLYSDLADTIDDTCSAFNSPGSVILQDTNSRFMKETLSRFARRFSSPRPSGVEDIRSWQDKQPSDDEVTADFVGSIESQTKGDITPEISSNQANRRVQLVSGLRHGSLQASLCQTTSPTSSAVERWGTKGDHFDGGLQPSHAPSSQRPFRRDNNSPDRGTTNHHHNAKRLSGVVTTPLKKRYPTLQPSPSTPNFKTFGYSGLGPSGFTPKQMAPRSGTRMGSGASSPTTSAFITPQRANEELQATKPNRRIGSLCDRQATPYRSRGESRQVHQQIPLVPDVFYSDRQPSPGKTSSRNKANETAISSSFKLHQSKPSSSATILPDLHVAPLKLKTAKVTPSKPSQLPISKSSRSLSRSGRTTPASTLQNMSALPATPGATFSTLFRKRSHAGPRVMNPSTPRIPTTPTMHWRPFDEHPEPLSPWHYQDNSYNASPTPQRPKKSSSRR